jgi:hypothetical protein
MVEPQIVVLVVAGSSPVGHPGWQLLSELVFHSGFFKGEALPQANCAVFVTTEGSSKRLQIFH